jgi:hypothetical protein
LALASRPSLEDDDMPDRGLLELSSVRTVALDPAAGTPWRMPNARYAQLTYEVDQAAALEAMPPDVGRPVPCYARLFVLDAPESPIGPLKLALLFSGGRFRMLPRNVLVAGVVDGPVEAVSRTFGGPFGPGRVSLEREGQEARATVAAEGTAVATVRWPALHAIEPTMLRWDPWLAYALDDGKPQIVEFAPRPEPSAAFLSKGASLETPASLPRGHIWRRFRNLNTVSGAYLEGSLELGTPAVQAALPMPGG